MIQAFNCQICRPDPYFVSCRTQNQNPRKTKRGYKAFCHQKASDPSFIRTDTGVPETTLGPEIRSRYYRISLIPGCNPESTNRVPIIFCSRNPSNGLLKMNNASFYPCFETDDRCWFRPSDLNRRNLLLQFDQNPLQRMIHG